MAERGGPPIWRTLPSLFGAEPGLGPRAEASAVGIKKFHKEEEIWPVIAELGDRRTDYLIERMVAGDVYHVDAIVSEREVGFAAVHRYRKPLLDVTQSGGIFMSSTVE